MEENLKKMIEGYENGVFRSDESTATCHEKKAKKIRPKTKVEQIIINMPELRKQMKRRKSCRAKRK